MSTIPSTPTVPDVLGQLDAMAAATAMASDANEDRPVTRVLVADGNAAVRKILRHTFMSLGWQTVEAEDGEQAMRLAGEQPLPHAIVMDLNLAKINGCEVCRRLKADIQYRLIPIVALTSMDSNEEKIRAVEAGADEILSKPMNRAEVNVRLRTLVRMHRFNQEVIGAESVAMALARAVATKDGYSCGHIEQVANLAVKFAESLDIDAAELKILRYGAILHNVGKIAIPDAVLEKTGALTPREKALFQQHPRVGCDICAPLKPLKAVLPIIRHHKEHWDGTGFPDGLRENDIPLGAQIVGIVDVYSALTSDRPFRQALSHDEATRKLLDRGRQGIHNPRLLEQFIQYIDSTQQPAFEPSEQEATEESADVSPTSA